MLLGAVKQLPYPTPEVGEMLSGFNVLNLWDERCHVIEFKPSPTSHDFPSPVARVDVEKKQLCLCIKED